MGDRAKGDHQFRVFGELHIGNFTYFRLKDHAGRAGGTALLEGRGTRIDAETALWSAA